MRPKVALLIALFCLGPSLTACGQAGKNQVSVPPPRGLDSAACTSASLYDGPSGSTGNNGLDPEVYHQHKSTLSARMSNSLVNPPKSTLLDPGFNDIITPISPLPPGALLVQDTIDCALLGRFDKSGGGASFPGKGLLKWTGVWIAGGLPPDAQLDLHTCIATRLNPSHIPVKIWLGGENVKPDEQPTQFPIEEALWAVTYSTKGRIIHVWPSEVLSNQCKSVSQTSSNGAEDAVSNRVCGRPGGMCGLEVHTDRKSCVKVLDPTRLPHGFLGFTCKVGEEQVKVIETRMRCEDWGVLYPRCDAPQVCTDCEAPQGPDAGSPAP